MTVQELIGYLKELPQDAEVVEYAHEELGYTGGYSRVVTFNFLRLKETDFGDTQGEYSGEWICPYVKCNKDFRRKAKEELKEGDKLGIIISSTDYVFEK